MQIDKKEIEEQINRKIELGTKQFGKDFKFLVIEILSLEKMLNPETQRKSRLIPLSEWNNYYPYPTKGTLYQYHHNKEINGFDDCIEKGGNNCGRILINEDKFWKWHENRNKKD